MVTQTLCNKRMTLIRAQQSQTPFHCCPYLPLSGPFVQAFHSLDIPLILHFPFFVPQLIEQLSNFPKYLHQIPSISSSSSHNPYFFFSLTSFPFLIYLYSNATTCFYFYFFLQCRTTVLICRRQLCVFIPSLLFEVLSSSIVSSINYILIFYLSCFILCCNYAHTCTFL